MLSSWDIDIKVMLYMDTQEDENSKILADMSTDLTIFYEYKLLWNLNQKQGKNWKKYS